MVATHSATELLLLFHRIRRMMPTTKPTTTMAMNKKRTVFDLISVRTNDPRNESAEAIRATDIVK